MIGQFVTSKAGHDKGALYVVVAEEKEFVFLCDGRLKPLDRPKKKRLKHIQPIGEKVEPELVDALRNGSANNERIKYAIKQYQKERMKNREEMYVKK